MFPKYRNTCPSLNRVSQLVPTPMFKGRGEGESCSKRQRKKKLMFERREDWFKKYTWIKKENLLKLN